MPIEGLAQRLIRSMADAPYHLERPEIRTIDDALAWLHDQVWPIETDRERRLRVKYLLFLRWLHGDEWRARGGVDDR